MLKILGGFAAVVLVVLGAKYVSSHGRSSPAPRTPPPTPTRTIPDAGTG